MFLHIYLKRFEKIDPTALFRFDETYLLYLSSEIIQSRNKKSGREIKNKLVRIFRKMTIISLNVYVKLIGILKWSMAKLLECNTYVFIS